MKFSLPNHRWIICVLLLVSMSVRAETSSDLASLTTAGLTKVGNLYLLDVDAHLTERLKEIAVGERQLQSYTAQSRGILADISKSQDTIDALRRDYDSQIPLRDLTPDARAKNRIIDAMNADVEHIDEGTRYLQKRKAELAALVQPTEYINKTIQLADDVEAAAARYDELAKDEQVARAIDAAGAAGGKAHLGPSPLFKQQLPRLKVQRDKYKTASIKLSAEGGVPTVAVGINGKTTVPMTVDSGATFVSLTWSVAVKAGIKPTGSEPEAHLRIANGREINARIVTAPEIQVGQYSVKNVQCVVLPQGTDESAGCLLGGSFMKNFLYQMDLTAGVLSLTPVSATASSHAPAKPTTAPTTRTNSDGSFTITLTATIDGGDSIRITANGLIWTHNLAAWPTDVKVNDVRWDPQSWPTIASTEAFEPLRHVDLSTAKITAKKGRGTIELKGDQSSATLSIYDAENGADEYAVSITFSSRGSAVAPATQPVTSTSRTDRVR